MKILVTGAAGFIGFHCVGRLLADGHTVLGIDNLNAYYDVNLKRSRLQRLRARAGFEFRKLDVADRDGVRDLFTEWRPERVLHLAAQAGVRYSVENPHAYVDSNLTGFVNMLEGCRHNDVRHLVYASSSSVYGTNKKVPFAVGDAVDHPISLYAATKKANELMAHTYSHLFGLPTTGLRFFTVYGPWGRPDMALFKFTKAILEGRPIEVYNHGRMQRDFTYIDDVVDGVIRTMDHVPAGVVDSQTQPGNQQLQQLEAEGATLAPYRLYNIGNHQPVDLMRFIAVLEDALGRKATKLLVPMQPGDVPSTIADVEALRRDIGFAPSTPVEIGILRFVDWYISYQAEPVLASDA